MTPHDRVIELSTVTAIEPDAARAEQVRRRCQAKLARNARRQQSEARRRDAESPLTVSGLLVPLLLGALCVFYGAALLGTTLQIEASLR